MTPRRIVLVGPSGSGKTTISQLVGAQLRLPVFSQDDYRARGMRLQFFLEAAGRRVRNYEDVRMWDQHAVSSKMIVAAPTGFVAEGLHLLTYPRVLQIPNLEAYYLVCDHLLSLRRRSSRNRHLPSDESFALIGESQTELTVTPQSRLRGIRLIDARQPADKIAQLIVDRIIP